MQLTRQETIEQLREMAENNLKRREAMGTTGDNNEYVTLITQ